MKPENSTCTQDWTSKESGPVSSAGFGLPLSGIDTVDTSSILNSNHHHHHHSNSSGNKIRIIIVIITARIVVKIVVIIVIFTLHFRSFGAPTVVDP